MAQTREDRLIAEAYDSISLMELPVYVTIFGYSRGYRYFRAMIVSVKAACDNFTPKAIAYSREFTAGSIPSMKEFIEMLPTGKEAIIHTEEVTMVYGLDKSKLIKALTEAQKEDKESFVHWIVDTKEGMEIAEIQNLPDISAQWERYNDRQKALKSNEHGMDLTF